MRSRQREDDRVARRQGDRPQRARVARGLLSQLQGAASRARHRDGAGRGPSSAAPTARRSRTAATRILSALRWRPPRWSYLVAFVRRTNAFFAGKGAPLSLYHMSLLNPLNAVPLRLACAPSGISAGFYHDLIVPLYASSFLSTDLAMTPLVIVPIIDDLISTHAVPSMESWKASSRDVFSRMAADTACIGALKVRAGRRVGFAFRDPADGRWALTCIGAEPVLLGVRSRGVRGGRARGGRRAAEYVGVDGRACSAVGRLLRRAGVRQGSRALGRVGAAGRPPRRLATELRTTLRSSAAAAAAAAVREHLHPLVVVPRRAERRRR